MTIAELITKLSEFDSTIPVYLADWQEGWAIPEELKIEDIAINTDIYRSGVLPDKFLKLGRD